MIQFPSDAGSTLHCVRHPAVETALRCGKCEDPICTRCIVQTPVGARCRTCSGIGRRSPMAVGTGLLLRAFGTGVAIATFGWLIADEVSFLRFILVAFLGAVTGSAMSLAARRRTSRLLECAAASAVIVGFVVAQVVTLTSTGSHVHSTSVGLAVAILPIGLAAALAVFRVR